MCDVSSMHLVYQGVRVGTVEERKTAQRLVTTGYCAQYAAEVIVPPICRDHQDFSITSRSSPGSPQRDSVTGGRWPMRLLPCSSDCISEGLEVFPFWSSTRTRTRTRITHKREREGKSVWETVQGDKAYPGGSDRCCKKTKRKQPM